MYRESYSSYSLGADYTSFVGNSFYSRAGLHYRAVKRQNESLRTAEENYRDIHLRVSIGNQWQWSNFTLGVDWIGFNTRVYEISDLNMSDWDYLADGDELLTFNLNLLQLNLGLSF